MPTADMTKNRNGMLIFHKNVVDLHTVFIFTFKQK